MRTSLLVLVFAITFSAGCSDDVDAQRTDWTLVANRLWIERAPKDARDMVKQLVLIDEAGERVGVAMLCSRFRWFVDAVDWRGVGDELRLRFLQTQRDTAAKARAWTCTGKAPPPFELCLELREGDQTRRYYSRKDWVVGSTDDARALALTLVPVDDAGDAPSAVGAFGASGLDVDDSLAGPATF